MPSNLDEVKTLLIQFDLDVGQFYSMALRKVENSDCCIFAKFGTRFFRIPYSVFSVLCQNRILRNMKQNAEYSKPLFLGQNPLFLGQKPLCVG
jgi:hypothetical protein